MSPPIEEDERDETRRHIESYLNRHPERDTVALVLGGLAGEGTWLDPEEHRELVEDVLTEIEAHDSIKQFVGNNPDTGVVGVRARGPREAFDVEIDAIEDILRDRLTNTPNDFPEAFVERDAWVPWSDMGRKQPDASGYFDVQRAREEGEEKINTQSWSDPRIWTDFETANAQVIKDDIKGIGFVLQKQDDPYDEDPDPFVVVDYDKVRDPETGEMHPIVREHIERAGSYTDISTSGTGVHICGIGELPDGVKTITDDLPACEGFPDAEIEVYDGKRFMAMTGDRIEGTPDDAQDVQGFVDNIAEEFTGTPEGSPDTKREPEKTRVEVRDLDYTVDIEDVFDAISHTRPGDINLKSVVTEERNDGSKSLNPSWEESTTGKRIGEVDDGWIYRKGSTRLDALHIVALEKGIVTDPNTYPSGSDFFNALDALRERGGKIPKLVSTPDQVIEACCDGWEPTPDEIEKVYEEVDE